jgi:hypothetical protein
MMIASSSRLNTVERRVLRPIASSEIPRRALHLATVLRCTPRRRAATASDIDRRNGAIGAIGKNLFLDQRASMTPAAKGPGPRRLERVFSQAHPRA